MNTKRALILHAPDPDDHKRASNGYIDHFTDWQIQTNFFDKLGFECTDGHPCTDKEVRELIDVFIEEVELQVKECQKEGTHLDCIAIFVSAHGVEVQTEDGYEHQLRLTRLDSKTREHFHTFVKVKEHLIDPVLERNEVLRHVKKIFFIASCRSREDVSRIITVDQGVRIMLTDDVNEEYTVVDVSEQDFNVDQTVNITEIDQLQTGPTEKGYEGANAATTVEKADLFISPDLLDDCIVIYSTQSGRASSTKGLGMSMLELKILEVIKEWKKPEVSLLDFMVEVNNSLSKEIRKVPREKETTAQPSPNYASVASVSKELNVTKREEQENSEASEIQQSMSRSQSSMHTTSSEVLPVERKGNHENQESGGESSGAQILRLDKLQITTNDIIHYCPCLSIVHNLSSDIVFTQRN